MTPIHMMPMDEEAKLKPRILAAPWGDPDDAVITYWIESDKRWANWPFDSEPTHYVEIGSCYEVLET